MLKVTLAQLNYMVGDISGNIRRMREAQPGLRPSRPTWWCFPNCR